MIEENIQMILTRLLTIETKLEIIMKSVVSERINPSTNEEMEKRIKNLQSGGDENRYCSCGKKLGSNKGLGKCKECLKKLHDKGDT